MGHEELTDSLVAKRKVKGHLAGHVFAQTMRFDRLHDLQHAGDGQVDHAIDGLVAGFFGGLGVGLLGLFRRRGALSRFGPRPAAPSLTATVPAAFSFLRLFFGYEAGLEELVSERLHAWGRS